MKDAVTVHQLALAASVNLENAAKGFDILDNVGIALATLEEIVGRTA